MEKVIISEWGSIIALNLENNAIRKPVELYNNKVIKVHAPTQIITENEVIDVDKDCYVALMHSFSEDGRSKSKPIIISDPVTIYDIDRFLEDEAV